MLHAITLFAIASAIALGIYLAYVPYEEEFHGDGYGGDTRLLSRDRGGGGGGDGVVSMVVAVGWGLGGVGGA
nr:hypothetical protein [Tanacetum cinerariifolium]